VPVARQSALEEGEVDEVVSLIADGRTARHTVVLPERLQTRHWPSVTRVSLALDDRLGWESLRLEDRRRQRGDPALGGRAQPVGGAHPPSRPVIEPGHAAR
jgi:hypothetical protein